MKTSIKELMIEGFGGPNSQIFYTSKVNDGLWISEKHFINKYFTKKDSGEENENNSKDFRLLDMGCGTGRTTIPLVEMGYTVTGVDIVPNMIESAKRIASDKKLTIDYRVGDATELDLQSDSYDYALFSNQGWSQIPERSERQKALKEIRRVLRKDGIFIFTTHVRIIWTDPLYWWEQWVRYYILKPLGFRIEEINFGDLFFYKEPSDTQLTYENTQYIHFPTITEMRKEIKESGFTLVEISDTYQISDKDVRKHPPVLYICQK